MPAHAGIHDFFLSQQGTPWIPGVRRHDDVRAAPVGPPFGHLVRLGAALRQTSFAAHRVASREPANMPHRHAAASAQNPKSAFPRIYPMNPEPAAAPAQNPKPTFPRIYPMNPEPAAAPAQNLKSTFLRIYPMNPEPAAAPAQNPKSTFPRIYPMNPEPTAALAPNPNSAFSRIHPMNPEPTAVPAQTPNPRFRESSLWPRNRQRRAS
jgi:hypothetical protein